jgi:hypothetical protein
VAVDFVCTVLDMVAVSTHANERNKTEKKKLAVSRVIRFYYFAMNDVSVITQVVLAEMCACARARGLCDVHGK